MPLYDFCCPNEHTTERFFHVEEKPFEIRCPKCRTGAQQVITYAPSLHTLGTFSKDIQDRTVQATRDPGDGSYCDPNIFDRKTGKHPRITSPKQRQQVMRDLGLYELPQNDRTKETDSYKRRKPITVSARSTRRQANG